MQQQRGHRRVQAPPGGISSVVFGDDGERPIETTPSIGSGYTSEINNPSNSSFAPTSFIQQQQQHQNNIVFNQMNNMTNAASYPAMIPSRPPTNSQVQSTPYSTARNHATEFWNTNINHSPVEVAPLPQLPLTSSKRDQNWAKKRQQWLEKKQLADHSYNNYNSGIPNTLNYNNQNSSHQRPPGGQDLYIHTSEAHYPNSMQPPSPLSQFVKDVSTGRAVSRGGNRCPTANTNVPVQQVLDHILTGCPPRSSSQYPSDPRICSNIPMDCQQYSRPLTTNTYGKNLLAQGGASQFQVPPYQPMQEQSLAVGNCVIQSQQQNNLDMSRSLRTSNGQHIAIPLASTNNTFSGVKRTQPPGGSSNWSPFGGY